MSIKRVFNIFKRYSPVWNVEKNKDILVLDGEGSEYLIPCFSNYDFFIIDSRNIIYLRCLLEAIFLGISFNFDKIKHLYYMRMIAKINPKLIITFTDNSSFFWKIDKSIHNRISFLTVQNGNHYLGSLDYLEEGFDHLFLEGDSPFYSNLACISQYDADYYLNNGLNVKKYYTIGSLKLSKYISNHVKKPKKIDLCIVANSINDRPANIKVWELILKYMELHDVTVCIAIKSSSDSRNQPLYDFFQETNAIFAKNANFSSQYLSDISEVTVGFASTLLRQTFSRGNKIYPLNFASNLFDLPYKYLGETLRPSYSQFESHLNHLLVQSNKEYNDQNSDLMKYLDVYNPRISPELMLEKVITDLIKK